MTASIPDSTRDSFKPLVLCVLSTSNHDEVQRLAELLKINAQDAAEFGRQIQAKLSSRSIDLNDVVSLLETYIKSLPRESSNFDGLISSLARYNENVALEHKAWSALHESLCELKETLVGKGVLKKRKSTITVAPGIELTPEEYEEAVNFPESIGFSIDDDGNWQPTELLPENDIPCGWSSASEQTNNPNAEIDSFETDTVYLLNELMDYHKQMETQLQFKRISETISTKSLKPRNLDDIDGMIDGIWWRDVQFQHFLRYSFVVLLHLAVEDRITKFCNLIGEKQHLHSRIEKRNGSCIKPAKDYLHKTARIPEVNWIPIENLAKVRNCIVHTMGNVKSSRDEPCLRQLASKTVSLSISEPKDMEFDEDTLVIESSYCVMVVSQAASFFDELFERSKFKLTSTS
jgi:hypothetical protein